MPCEITLNKRNDQEKEREKERLVKMEDRKKRVEITCITTKQSC